VRRQIPILAVAVLAFLVVVFVHALSDNLPIMHRWIDRRYLFVFPAIGAIAAIVLASSVLTPQRLLAILYGLADAYSAFRMLALSFFPCMIPFVVTIDDAGHITPVLRSCFGVRACSCTRLCSFYVAIGYPCLGGRRGHAPSLRITDKSSIERVADPSWCQP
jgi:cytochrome bd ubiquinol oxidase subunit II